MQALRLFGTDFTLIERMFPGRQRKALKNKLQREYRADFARVDSALSGGGAASQESLKEVVALLKQVRPNEHVYRQFHRKEGFNKHAWWHHCTSFLVVSGGRWMVLLLAGDSACDMDTHAYLAVGM